LRNSLAPLEYPIIGMVSTTIRVKRDRCRTYLDSFLNFLSCIELERRNFEGTATYNLDGGVSTVSSSTGLVRTSIVHSVEYQRGLLNETFFGKRMRVDDDNYTARYMVNHGWKNVIQNHKDLLMLTSFDFRSDILSSVDSSST
jgi:cellulose synthase/poly-beta-1,6-N-acetylglucosamine synthase-like glycosyltransferase